VFSITTAVNAELVRGYELQRWLLVIICIENNGFRDTVGDNAL